MRDVEETASLPPKMPVRVVELFWKDCFPISDFISHLNVVEADFQRS